MKNTHWTFQENAEKFMNVRLIEESRWTESVSYIFK